MMLHHQASHHPVGPAREQPFDLAAGLTTQTDGRFKP